MTCPFLEYRREDDDRSFDEARAYCVAVDRFVQPMRADICNDRYDLDHAADCEIYRKHADDATTAAEERIETPDSEGTTTNGEGRAADEDRTPTGDDAVDDGSDGSDALADERSADTGDEGGGGR